MRTRAMQALVAVALVATVAVAVPVSQAPSADAAMKSWYATVTRVVDGDTVEVRWDQGDSAPSGMSQPRRIRVVGVDTNELNECMAQAATEFTESLIPPGTVIRVAARNKGSEALGRPLRHVFFGGKHKKNLAIELLEAGMGLAMPFGQEPTHAPKYFAAAEYASVNEIGMWEPGACGGSPGSWPELDVTANLDPVGSDNGNLNGEWIQVRNQGPGSLVMNGWTVRGTERLNGGVLRIPSGTTIPAGGKLRIYMGSGTNTATSVYVNRPESFLANAKGALYIRDQHLNIRVFQVWPCTLTCENNGTVKVEAVSADPPGDDNDNPNGEWIRLRNTGSKTVDLSDWKVADNTGQYHFTEGRSLAPGQTLTLYIGQGNDSGSAAYWGNSASLLGNTGAALWVYDNHHRRIDCFAYGNADCKNEPVRGAIQLTANYDAKGADAKNLNGEWIALENTSDKRVNLSGHKIRVGDEKYRFPKGTWVSAGKRLRVRIGDGNDRKYKKHWGLSEPLLENAGGTVQLRDRKGKILLSHSWPCGDCGPDGSFVLDAVRYTSGNASGEQIVIRNVGSDRASLRDHVIKAGGTQKIFLKNVWLDPDETLRFVMGSGQNTGSTKYWGISGEVLDNAGERVSLLSPFRETVDCHAWGSASCPGGKQSVAAGISISANYDAEGNDAENPNGEWVDLRNVSSNPIDLDGLVMLSDARTYAFDAGDVIPAGQRLRVYSGEGTDNGLDRYAGDDLAPLANTHDEVSLLSADGAVIKYFSY